MNITIRTEQDPMNVCSIMHHYSRKGTPYHQPH